MDNLWLIIFLYGTLIAYIYIIKMNFLSFEKRYRNALDWFDYKERRYHIDIYAAFESIMRKEIKAVGLVKYSVFPLAILVIISSVYNIKTVLEFAVAFSLLSFAVYTYYKMCVMLDMKKLKYKA